MGTIYRRRGNKVWQLGYFDPAKKRQVCKSSGVRDERLARQALDRIEAAIAKEEFVSRSPQTLASYAKAWTTQRVDRVWSATKELRTLERHVLPELGGKRLVEVQRRDVRDLVKQLRRQKPALATRTIRNIYSALRSLFAEAVAEGLLEVSPCVLMSGDMPAIADKDPGFRAGAEYSKAEVELLISSDKLEHRWRMWWALGFLTGMRHGEVSALRWRDYDPTVKPLGRFSVTGSYSYLHHKLKGTKTGKNREVPVHLTLAAMLAEWRLTGWEAFQGTAPKPEDLILPNAKGGYLTDSTTKKTRPRDLAALGLRVRRFHDARSTFITLGTVDGAEEVWLERVTHNAKGNQFNQYRRTSWPKLCEAVGKLQITRLGAELHQLRAVSGDPRQGREQLEPQTSAGGRQDLLHRLLRSAGNERVLPSSSQLASVGPGGFEPPTPTVSR